MARPIIVDGAERVACPKCNHGFPLSEGISRQAIERHAEEFERGNAEQRRKLEAELAAEAKAQFDLQRKAMNEALSAKEAALGKFRNEELQLRRQLRELEEAKKNQELDYQRKLDEERKRIEEQARAAAGEEIGAVHALGHRDDFVHREGLAQQRFEGDLEAFHAGVELALGAALRFGGELGLELAALLGVAALEFVGVALDGLARDALGEGKAVVALRAGDALRAVDDDGSGHGLFQRLVRWR